MVGDKINGKWFTDGKGLKGGVEAFQNFPFEYGDWMPNCDGLTFNIS